MEDLKNSRVFTLILIQSFQLFTVNSKVSLNTNLNEYIYGFLLLRDGIL